MKKNNKWSTIRTEKWEHDRWSGPELLERKEFKTLRAAENYCIKINSRNTEPNAPDYYIEAHIVN